MLASMGTQQRNLLMSTAVLYQQMTCVFHKAANDCESLLDTVVLNYISVTNTACLPALLHAAAWHY